MDALDPDRGRVRAARPGREDRSRLHREARGGLTLEHAIGLGERVALALPRIGTADLLPLLGVELAPAPLDLRHLADAAAGALALPDLDGQDAPRVRARQAAVQLALATGLTTSEVADALHVTTRSVRRLASAPEHADLVRAVTLQLRLRAALAAR